MSAWGRALESGRGAGTVGGTYWPTPPPLGHALRAGGEWEGLQGLVTAGGHVTVGGSGFSIGGGGGGFFSGWGRGGVASQFD